MLFVFGLNAIFVSIIYVEAYCYIERDYREMEEIVPFEFEKPDKPIFHSVIVTFCQVDGKPD